MSSLSFCLLVELAYIEEVELLPFLYSNHVLDEFLVAEEAMAVLTHSSDKKVFDLSRGKLFTCGRLLLQSLVYSVLDILL